MGETIDSSALDVVDALGVWLRSGTWSRKSLEVGAVGGVRARSSSCAERLKVMARGW
jgi:hypothetical protein